MTYVFRIATAFAGLATGIALWQVASQALPDPEPAFQVNELSAAELVFRFYNTDNIQIKPTGLSCWMNDKVTGQELWSRQSWTPTTKDVRIVIPSTEQTIQRSGLCSVTTTTVCTRHGDCPATESCLPFDRERHLLTCEWQFGGENFMDEVPFDVVNFVHAPYVTATPTASPTVTPG